MSPTPQDQNSQTRAQNTRVMIKVISITHTPQEQTPPAAIEDTVGHLTAPHSSADATGGGGASLCLQWGSPLSAMGQASVCNGASLCLQWGKPLSAMGQPSVCNGAALCNVTNYCQ